MKYKVVYETSTVEKVLNTQEFIFNTRDAAKLHCYNLLQNAIDFFDTEKLQYLVRIDNEYTWLESKKMSVMVGFWEVANDYGLMTNVFQ